MTETASPFRLAGDCQQPFSGRLHDEQCTAGCGHLLMLHSYPAGNCRLCEALAELELAMETVYVLGTKTTELAEMLALALERHTVYALDEDERWWPPIDHAKQAEMAAERHRIAGGISDDAPVFEAAVEHHRQDPPDADDDRYYCSCGYVTDMLSEMLRHRQAPATDQRAGRDPLEVAEMDARTRTVSLGLEQPPAIVLAEADQEAGYALEVPFPASFDASTHAMVPTCPHCRHTHQPGTFCGVPIAPDEPEAGTPNTCQCEGWPE
jgi:hypothetical protein